LQRRPLALLATLLATTAFAFQSNLPKDYKGTPYQDDRHKNAPQSIPGKVECAYYDSGGEGIAYHDTDPVNHGSGELNPADGSYLHEFRIHEGVDTSYTKFHTTPDPTDNSPYTLVLPPPDQLYVGWTEPGEWFNLTVHVAHTGLYTPDILYTSNRGGSISIDVNGTPAGAPINIPSTFNTAEPVAWRQWHHWNLATNLVKLNLPAGKNLLTIRILTGGNMNLAWFDFKQP